MQDQLIDYIQMVQQMKIKLVVVMTNLNGLWYNMMNEKEVIILIEEKKKLWKYIVKDMK